MSKTTFWRVVGRGFVVGVETNEHDIIIRTAPLVARFLGQPLNNLRRWRAVESIDIIDGSSAA